MKSGNIAFFAGIAGALLAALVYLSTAGIHGDEQETAAAGSTTLRVGVLPDQGADALAERYAPLIDYLSQDLEIPVEYVASESYTALVDRFVAGEIDLAYFGGLTFLQANREAGAVPLVMRDVDAKFTSYFLVPADSTATDLNEFRGRTFSFGSRLSTSGHLMPRFFLVERDIEPESFFGEVRYSGAHDQTAYDVRDGVADVGAANTYVIRAMFADGRLNRNDVRVLWQTPPYPDYVWALHPNVDSTLRRRLRDAFLSLSPVEEGHERILERLSAGAFLPAGVKDFAPLGAIAEQMQLLTEKR